MTQWKDIIQTYSRWSLGLVIVFGSIFGTGCSQRWIEADTGLSSDEVFQRVSEMSRQNVFSSSSSQFDDILNTEGAYIYYTDGGGDSPMGPAEVAVGLLDFSIFGNSGESIQASDLDTATVVYVEDIDRASLLVQITTGQDSQPVTLILDSVEAPTYDGEEYSVLLGQGGQALLRLSTYNTVDNDLQGVIRFQVYDFTSGGEEQWLGQFGAMVGYF